jgi:hypothetical protein
MAACDQLKSGCGHRRLGKAPPRHAFLIDADFWSALASIMRVSPRIQLRWIDIKARQV